MSEKAEPYGDEPPASRSCPLCHRPNVSIVSEGEAGGIVSRVHSDGTLCEGPTTRVTEAELLALESDAGKVLVASVPPGALIETLVAEIRRYRALLLGLDLQTRGALQVEAPYCPFCRELIANVDGQRPRLRGTHHTGCSWAELEAEVQAIRRERGGAGS